MKKILFVLTAAVSLVYGDDPYAPPPMTTSEKLTDAPQTTLDVQSKEGSKTQSKTPAKPQEKKKEAIPPPIALPKPVAQTASYFHPGILVLQNGVWEGSDHLLNLTNQIGVHVTIVKPDGVELPFKEEQIRGQVESIFEKEGIKPQTMAIEGFPPLPVFEIQIFVYPIEKGFVASCAGRLFESVTLARFRLDEKTAFQAITWEKQTLLVSPTSKFLEQISKNVGEIADSFTSRFRAYQKLSTQN